MQILTPTDVDFDTSWCRFLHHVVRTAVRIVSRRGAMKSYMAEARRTLSRPHVRVCGGPNLL